MSVWQSILVAIGGNAVLVAVLGWAAKKLIEIWLKRDSVRLEAELRADSVRFEAELRAKSDAAIERLKADLHLAAVEHQVRFTRMHEKRADVIAELYSCLVELIWAAEDFLSPMQFAGTPRLAEKYRIADERLVAFFRYLDKNRIYFPNELCDSLFDIGKEIRSRVIHYGVYAEYEHGQAAPHVMDEKMEASRKGWDAIKTQIPAARSQLEEQFRGLLGVSTEHTEGDTEGKEG